MILLIPTPDKQLYSNVISPDNSELDKELIQSSPQDNTGSSELSDPITHIPVVDLDISDIESPMIVGTSQVLVVSTIPLDATEQTIRYLSVTPNVASVNAIGRITALAPGTAIIQISSEEITRSVSITIEPKYVETVVRVTNIDVDFEKIFSARRAEEAVIYGAEKYALARLAEK